MRNVCAAIGIALIILVFAVALPEVSTSKLLSCERGIESTDRVFRIQRFGGYDHVVSNQPFRAQFTKDWTYLMHDSLKYEAGEFLASRFNWGGDEVTCFTIYGLPPGNYILKDENGKNFTKMEVFYDFTPTIHASQIGDGGPMGVVVVVLPGQQQKDIVDTFFRTYGDSSHAPEVWDRIKVASPYELISIPLRGD
jgi:hypothetical protein